MSSQKDIFATVFTAIAETIQSLIKQDFLNKVLGFFGGGLAGIIMGIAMIFVMFRLFFMLLIAYVSIIILTVLSPILLLFHAMPGNNGAKDWFRQVAANIAVFPAVAIMIVLAGALSGIGKLGGNTATMFDSANVGQFPLLTGGLNLQNVGSLIGLGILLMTPAVGNMVKERFGVKGGAIAAGAGMAAATLGAAGRAARAPADYYAKPYLQARQGKRYMDYLDKMRGQRETVPPGHEPGKLPGQS